MDVVVAHAVDRLSRHQAQTAILVGEIQDANVKLDSVISDVLGMSGRKIIRAIIAGEESPEVLAALGSVRLKCKREDLRESLRGKVTAHHRFMLKQHLDVVEALERGVSDFDQEIGRMLEPFRAEVKRLTTIPGVSELSAAASVEVWPVMR